MFGTYDNGMGVVIENCELRITESRTFEERGTFGDTFEVTQNRYHIEAPNGAAIIADEWEFQF